VKTKFSTRAVVAIVAGALVLGGSAIAFGSPVNHGAVAAGAQAALKAPIQPRNVTADTNIVLKSKPSSPVAKGTSVKFKGTLNSSEPSCIAGKTISYAGGSTTTSNFGTSPAGKFSFTLKIKKKQTVTATFAGDTSGVHPDIVTCNGSAASLKIKIK
jgi:hypothetical protein